MDEEIKLVINIKYHRPIELLNLTLSLNSLVSIYHHVNNNDRNIRLFITEIRKSSIEFHIITDYMKNLMPFLNDAHILIKFVNYIKALIFTCKKQEADAINILHENNLPSTDSKNLQDFAKFLGLIKLPEERVDLRVENNHGVILSGCVFNGVESKEMLGVIGELAPKDEVFKREKMLFRWVQSNFEKSNSGNRGLIENIWPRPLKVIFADDATKFEMMTSQEGNSWQDNYYSVDVEIAYADKKPRWFKILKNHPEEAFPIKEDEQEELFK